MCGFSDGQEERKDLRECSDGDVKQKRKDKEDCSGGNAVRKRIHWVDALRGWSIISMVAYHVMWDLVYLYGLEADWYRGLAGHIWQQSICIVFIGLSGFCWCLDRHPVKRGLLVSAGGLLVTVVTWFAAYEARALFGVLTLIGASILLMIPLDRILRPMREHVPAAGFLAAFFMFLLFYSVNSGVLSLGDRVICVLPRALYRNLFTTFLGFPMPGFYSSDYFSLLPWFFLYESGYFFYGIYHKMSRMPEAVEAGGGGQDLQGITKERPPCRDGQEADRHDSADCHESTDRHGIGELLAFLGKHSFLIYLLHQPVLSLIFAIIFS